MTTPSKRQISENRRLLGDQYAFLDETGHLSAISPGAASKTAQDSHTRQLEQSKRPGYLWIERAARKLHEKIWQQRHELWPGGVPFDPVQLLDPSIALHLIGFEFDIDETLGQFTSKGATFEVAGVIDRPARHVRISRQMPFSTRRFTAAHELAHAVLHEGVLMHRDRPLDGSAQEHGPRDNIEKEADKFASYFLMPENLVRKRFRQYYLCDKFVINEATIFALDPMGSMGLQEGKRSGGHNT